VEATTTRLALAALAARPVAALAASPAAATLVMAAATLLVPVTKAALQVPPRPRAVLAVLCLRAALVATRLRVVLAAASPARLALAAHECAPFFGLVRTH